MIGFDQQIFRDEFNRHGGVVRKDFMELGRHASNVIDDDDRHPHIRRKILQEPDIGVETTGRAADANNRKIFH